MAPESRHSEESSRRALTRWSLCLALANAALLTVLGSRYLTLGAPPADWLGRVFTALMWPAHFTTLALLALPPLWLALLAAPGRWVLGFGAGLYALLAALVLADTQFYALYRFHLNGMVWNLFTSGVAHEILPISGSAWLQAGALLIALLALEGALAFWLWRWLGARPRRGARALAVAVAICLLAAHGLHAWADAYLYTPITRQVRALPWIRPATAHRFMERRGWIASAMAEASTVPFSESALSYPLTPLACAPPEPPPNLLVIAIEEWRADELDPVTSPHIWEFAQQAATFADHHSTGNASRYGLFGLFYGLHGTYWEAMLAEQRGPVLLELLQELGYRPFVRASASLLHPEFDRTIFADFRGRIPLDSPGESPSVRDRFITDHFLDFLERRSRRPFFGFLFYDSPHAMDHPDDWPVPHHPARRWGNHLELDADTDPEPLANQHANSIHYVDALVGEVLAALERTGLLDATVVVIAGDHGEEFNDSGLNYWGHNSNFGRFQTGVGFVLHLPGRTPTRVDARTSHVDLAPTLLEEVFGCTTTADQFSNGQNLFEERRRPHLVASGGSVGIGILEADRITVLERSGGFRVMDRDLRELEGAAPEASRVRSVLDEISRFYLR